MRFVAMVLVVMAVLLALSPQAFGELLQNPGFEQLTVEGDPVGWSDWGAYASWGGDGYTEFENDDPTYVAYEGVRCGRAFGSEYALWYQTLTFDSDWIPGRTYSWGFWAKDVNDGGASAGPVITSVRFFDTVGEGGNGDGEVELEHTIPYDGQWHYVEFEFTIPEGMVEMTMRAGQLEGGDYLIDQAYLDDLPYSPLRATEPSPLDKSIQHISLSDLSWTNPAGVVDVDVYWLDAGTSPRAKDPNMGPAVLDPGVVKLVDGLAVSTASLPALTFGHYYYWAVHVTDSSTETQGIVWEFNVDDAPPVTDAGPDQYEGLDPTVATVDLDGSATTDDGNSPQTYLWTVAPAGPVIASDTSQVTTASVSATGTYTFTLTATDATGGVADTMTARVYDTPCDAVYADPAEAPFLMDISGPVGDPDCEVDVYDLAATAADWLDCMSTKLGCTP